MNSGKSKQNSSFELERNFQILHFYIATAQNIRQVESPEKVKKCIQSLTLVSTDKYLVFFLRSLLDCIIEPQLVNTQKKNK